MKLLTLLNALPFNGYKRWIGLAAYVVVLGCMSAGFLDQHTGEVLLGIITVWTGVAVAHADMKASQAE